MNKNLEIVSQEAGNILKAKGLKLVLAESCTGGLVASAITAISGSSAYFDRGYVTYSNESKIDILHVSSDNLEKYGAVSEQVVCEMAEGALRKSRANVSIAVTGIAGPTGGTREKPVGTIFFAWKISGSAVIWKRKNFNGTRNSIRLQAAIYVLTELIQVLENIA